MLAKGELGRSRTQTAFSNVELSNIFQQHAKNVTNMKYNFPNKEYHILTETHATNKMQEENYLLSLICQISLQNLTNV